MEATPVFDTCLNCQTVFEGKYCNRCGQKAQQRRLPIKALLHDAMHDVFHFENKIFATLWMLIRKPGFLTKEYLEGRRTQWFPPFRLFLVTSGLFFLTTSSIFHYAYQPRKTEHGINIEELQRDQPNKKSKFTIKLKKGMKNAFENPEKLFDKAFSYGTKAPFFLMPVFAVLLYIFDRRKNKLFFDSLTLSMHHHALSFIILPLAFLLDKLLANRWYSMFMLPIYLTPVAHLAASMRLLSGQGWIISLARSSIVSLIYLIFITLAFLLTLLTSWFFMA